MWFSDCGFTPKWNVTRTLTWILLKFHSSPVLLIHTIYYNIYLLLYSCQPPSFSILSSPFHCVGQNNQEYRLKYWATCSSIRLFAGIAHSFACSALFASLARSAALTRSLARLLRSLPSLWDSEWLNGYLFCVFFYSGPKCPAQIITAPAQLITAPAPRFQLYLFIWFCILSSHRINTSCLSCLSCLSCVFAQLWSKIAKNTEKILI